MVILRTEGIQISHLNDFRIMVLNQAGLLWYSRSIPRIAPAAKEARICRICSNSGCIK